MGEEKGRIKEAVETLAALRYERGSRSETDVPLTK